MPSTTAAMPRTWLIAATSLMATLGVTAAVSGLAAPTDADVSTGVNTGVSTSISTSAPGDDPQTLLAVDKWPRRRPRR